MNGVAVYVGAFIATCDDATYGHFFLSRWPNFPFPSATYTHIYMVYHQNSQLTIDIAAAAVATYRTYIAARSAVNCPLLSTVQLFHSSPSFFFLSLSPLLAQFRLYRTTTSITN